MSKVTELDSCQITAVDVITIELVEANEAPAVVIIRWPAKPSVLHLQLFPGGADTAARYTRFGLSPGSAPICRRVQPWPYKSAAR